MVSFWPRPRKTVLTGTFLFPLKFEFLATNYEVIKPCLQLLVLFVLERKVQAEVQKWHGCKLSLQFRVEPARKAYRLEHGLSYSMTSV